LSDAGENCPETFYTDALKSYQMLMASLPESERPKHIAKAGIRKPDANNNRIERLNGTLRERVKVQRGWKIMKTPLAEGQRLHYNFVKPHGALEGQTQAERAGVGSREKTNGSVCSERQSKKTGQLNQPKWLPSRERTRNKRWAGKNPSRFESRGPYFTFGSSSPQRRHPQPSPV
jgi:hypothetical protein